MSRGGRERGEFDPEKLSKDQRSHPPETGCQTGRRLHRVRPLRQGVRAILKGDRSKKLDRFLKWKKQIFLNVKNNQSFWCSRQNKSLKKLTPEREGVHHARVREARRVCGGCGSSSSQ